ncbi:MAG: AAA family ATPase [bacterium]
MTPDAFPDALPDVESLVDGLDSTGPSQAEFETDSVLPLEFFHLHTAPFLDSVNPHFFFRTEAHEETFVKMKQCVEEDIALGLTTAVSGTGKTLLTQLLLNDLDPRKYRMLLLLVYPNMSRTAILEEIVRELGLEITQKRPTLRHLMAYIQQEIIRLYEEKTKLVLIIDEAHFLRADSLHLLRTLSNIEIPEKKLVTVLLFAEECFLTRLSDPIYKALFSRMFMRCDLRPLTLQEIEQYVKFRVLVAGGKPGLFDDNVFPVLAELSKGIPREINRICHNALLTAAARRRRIITGDLLRG